jgi:hypothetical protein
MSSVAGFLKWLLRKIFLEIEWGLQTGPREDDRLDFFLYLGVNISGLFLIVLFLYWNWALTMAKSAIDTSKVLLLSFLILNAVVALMRLGYRHGIVEGNWREFLKWLISFIIGIPFLYYIITYFSMKYGGGIG